jgi:hypothetical protein
MGDNPGRQTDKTPASGIDFNSILDAGTKGHLPDAVGRTADQTRPVAPAQDAIKIGTDATNTVVIANKTLELSYKDPNFDNKMLYASQHAANKFEIIKIDDLPTNVKINTWIDQNGYFMWYDDGTSSPKAHHYLPDNAFGLTANNAKIDLESERMKDNQGFAAKYLGGFQNFDRNFVPARDGTTNATNYYLQLAAGTADAQKLPGGVTTALAIQEHALRESVRTSGSPYYKIYLSDINAAQGLKYAADNHLQPNNEYTRKKIDDALSLSQAAWTQTNGELAKYNQFPKLSVYLPLAPQRPFWDHNGNPDDWMGYWGGGFNQSYGRAQALTSLRGAVISNFVPQAPHRVPNPRPPNPSG